MWIGLNFYGGTVSIFQSPLHYLLVKNNRVPSSIASGQVAAVAIESLHNPTGKLTKLQLQ